MDENAQSGSIIIPKRQPLYRTEIRTTAFTFAQGPPGPASPGIINRTGPPFFADIG